VPDATPPADIAPARPDIAPLMSPLTALRGVGPTLLALLTRATGGTRVLDLLFHMPESFVDRRTRPTIRDAVRGQVATLVVEVVRHEAPTRERQPWRVIVTDGTGFAELVFFKPQRAQALVAGAKVIVSGKLESFADRLTIPHPDHIVPFDQPERVPALEPVWPLTAGLFPSQVRGAMVQSLALIPQMPEWHDPALMRREGWPCFADALRALHTPTEHPGPKPRARLAYDELLAHQVAMAWVRKRERTRPGRSLPGTGIMRAEALHRFGHALTSSQEAALAEIDADMTAPSRMLRLLQGDVGSGKTLVAAMAMLRAVESGAQAALMAPTEILARQHHRTLEAICPVPVALLTGAVKGAGRRNLLLGLAAGRTKIVVGTHALFQEGVVYNDLGLAVIDEQHRFGVDQRLSMGGKGAAADVLVMTATPIPRTLLLTQWGEMSVSRLLEKPAGRTPIRTTLHSLSQIEEVVEAMARALDRGERIFWVCPLVSESELLDVAAAEDRYIALRRRFGNRVGIAHGQQDTALREASIASFARGETQLLVATTVVEVGVDVPEASVMVVDHADRFGLAQLHQLRGRVGRGAAASFCLLLHEDGLSETARRRLMLLRDTDDGFIIADEDFRIRGGGDMLGKRQSGLPGWRLADPVEHEGLLHMASRDAALLLQKDPKLESPRGAAVRILLRLFERGAAVKTLHAG
jgi:ATP-dependent DNA helicase RecG